MSQVKRISMSTIGESFREIACKSPEKSDALEIDTIKIRRLSTGRFRLCYSQLILQRHSIVRCHAAVVPSWISIAAPLRPYDVPSLAKKHSDRSLTPARPYKCACTIPHELALV